MSLCVSVCGVCVGMVSKSVWYVCGVCVYVVCVQVCVWVWWGCVCSVCVGVVGCVYVACVGVSVCV